MEVRHRDVVDLERPRPALADPDRAEELPEAPERGEPSGAAVVAADGIRRTARMLAVNITVVESRPCRSIRVARSPSCASYGS